MDRQPDPRARWGNAGRVALVTAALAAVVLWPRLAGGEPELPPEQPRPVVAGPAGAVADEPPAPTPAPGEPPRAARDEGAHQAPKRRESRRKASAERRTRRRAERPRRQRSAGAKRSRRKRPAPDGDARQAPPKTRPHAPPVWTPPPQQPEFGFES